jgi:hypothetical protein
MHVQDVLYGTVVYSVHGVEENKKKKLIFYYFILTCL